MRHPAYGMPTDGDAVIIDGALFTNHAIIGYVPPEVLTTINGSMVARDEAVKFYGDANNGLVHDLRLSMNPGASADAYLPLDFHRPRLTRWRDCAAGGCTQ